MKKISPLFLLALSMSCTTPMMKKAFDEDLDPQKFGDELNSHEVAFAKAIYDNDAQQAAAIANSTSQRKAIDIKKYINAQRFNKTRDLSFLLFAAFQDCPTIVALILDNDAWGASNMQGKDMIDQQSRGSQRTALHMAAERDYGEVVKILLNRGAAVDAPTKKGETPLHLALDSNYVAIAELLLANGAAVNSATRKGETPLHLAAKNNGVSVAAILVDRGANVDAKTKEGKTPLHLAVENNCKEAVSCLLSNHANHQVIDNQGRTPLALARRANHEAIVKILERHEKKSYRRLCLEGAKECDEHCTSCLSFGIFHHFNLDCSSIKAPCGLVCKTLCCAWSCCCPLPIEETAVPASSGSSDTTAPLLPGGATMQR